MDESSFEIDPVQLAEASRRFPAHRGTAAVHAHPGDLSYLTTAPEFGRHAWDEGGRP